MSTIPKEIIGSVHFMNKEQFIEWFFNHSPYWATPDMVYDKLKEEFTKPVYQLAPDSGEYWKKRCEAAEDLIAVMNVPKNKADGHNDSFLLFGERNDRWQKSKTQEPR